MNITYNRWCDKVDFIGVMGNKSPYKAISILASNNKDKPCSVNKI